MHGNLVAGDTEKTVGGTHEAVGSVVGHVLEVEKDIGDLAAVVVVASCTVDVGFEDLPIHYQNVMVPSRDNQNYEDY